MRYKLASVSRILCFGFALTLSSGCTDSGGDRNCADFSCQGDAQAWHNSHSNSDLDADNDGIACEHLPNCAVLAAEGEFALLLEESGSVLNLSIQVEDLSREPAQLVGAIEVDGVQLAMAGHLTGSVAWMHLVPREQGEHASDICLQLDTRHGDGVIMSCEMKGVPLASPVAAFRRFK